MSQIASKFIADNAVSTAKIANDAVDANKIAADAVGSSEIAANAVGSGELADNAVDTNAIQDDAVTAAKLGPASVDSAALNASAITGQTAETTADNADLILIYDDSATALKKMTRANFVAGLSSGTSLTKSTVQLVATSNLSLTGEQTIDGVLTADSRILLVGQSNPIENGIYVTDSGAWARSSDADADAEVLSGMMVYVRDGTNYNNTLWVLDTADPLSLGTNNLVFTKINYKPKKERLTLDSTDITNQYKDLAFLAEPGSVHLSITGIAQYEGSGIDYSLSTVGGVTRVTFETNLATGGASELVSGDILNFQYRY